MVNDIQQLTPEERERKKRKEEENGESAEQKSTESVSQKLSEVSVNEKPSSSKDGMVVEEQNDSMTDSGKIEEARGNKESGVVAAPSSGTPVEQGEAQKEATGSEGTKMDAMEQDEGGSTNAELSGGDGGDVDTDMKDDTEENNAAAADAVAAIVAVAMANDGDEGQVMMAAANIHALSPTRMSALSPAAVQKPVYVSGGAGWTPEESVALEDAMKMFPSDEYSSVAIYTKIAAMLPRKTIRDVAARMWQVDFKQASRADTGRGGAMDWGDWQKSPRRPTPGAQHHQPEQQMMQVLPPTPHIPDQSMESRIYAMLQENVSVITTMRENLLRGRLGDNYPYMHKFNDNVNLTLEMLNTLELRMPPMPVQVDTSLLATRMPMHPTHMPILTHKPGSPSMGERGQPPPAMYSLMGGPASQEGATSPSHGTRSKSRR